MASSINFSSVGSGIDFTVIRDAILDQRTKPVTQLQNRASSYSSRVDALKQLNTILATLTTSAETLTNRDLGTGRSVAAGDASILTGTATSTAVIGGYDITVNRLATKLTQASRSFTSTSAAVLADGTTTATFELRRGGATTGTAITIDSSNNSLAGLRDSINAANAGVTASIVDVDGDGTGRQLVLSSTATGSAGRVELAETTSTGTLASLNLRSLNPTDGDNSKLDASLTINGLAVTRSTNSIGDAISGVTLNLKKAGTTSLGVTQTTDIENKLRGFVNAYNAFQDFSATQYKKDSKNRPTGVLAGDSTFRTTFQQLQSATSSQSDDNGGIYTSLADLGITKNDDGTLKLDTAILNDKLSSNPDDVKALLFGKTTAQKGIFNSINDAFKDLSDSVTGTVQNAISGYQSSITTLNATIEQRLATLTQLKDSLTKRFSVADAAIGQLNGQSTSLTSIIKSLNGSSSS